MASKKKTSKKTTTKTTSKTRIKITNNPPTKNKNSNTTHTNHHTYTWHVGKDCQMPFDTPMTFPTWLLEVTGFALTRSHLRMLIQLATARYTETMKSVIPTDEFPRLRRNAWCFLGFYIAIGVAIALGATWLWWFLVLPTLLGRSVMLLFTLIQHVEMADQGWGLLFLWCSA